MPFDTIDMGDSHHGGNCNFDYIIKKYKINDTAISINTLIRQQYFKAHILSFHFLCSR
ncbi:MAG: chromate resistance protein [Chitinophagales bacterium]|nr:chromate resistance protein [Chitinophagales bacterium]